MSKIEQTEQADKHISGLSMQASAALLADANPWGKPDSAKPTGQGPALAEVGPNSGCFAIHRTDDGGKLVHDLYIADYGHAGTFDGMHKGSCVKM